MNISIQHTLHCLIISVAFFAGLMVFLIESLNNEFLTSIIYLSASILFVNIYGYFSRILTNNILGYIISIYLFVLAISVLGNFGFEATAVGFQTLYNINLEAVTCSVLLLLLSTTILIVVQNFNPKNKQNSNPNTVQINFLPKPKKAKPKKVLIDSKKWEEATTEDLKSGKYQTNY